MNHFMFERVDYILRVMLVIAPAQSDDVVFANAFARMFHARRPLNGNLRKASAKILAIESAEKHRQIGLRRKKQTRSYPVLKFFFGIVLEEVIVVVNER
jgi:hypothetical protein